MSTFYAEYPGAGGSSGGNASVGPTGTPAPTSATEVGFVDGSGNLQPFSGTSAGSGPNVAVTSSALPTGAATSANQVTQETTLTAIQANQTNGTQHTIVDSSALPTGAATSALQTTGNTSLSSILADMTNGTQVTQVSNFPATQPVSGTVAVTQSTSPWVNNLTQFGSTNISTGTGASGAGIPRVTVSNDSNILATQSGTWNITNISGTVSLPTGASTSANQTTLGSQTTKINDGTNTAAVKAASTAAVATDPALVVAISPNNTIATTTAVNTNGSASNSTTVTNTSATTFSAPANAVGFVVEAESSNTVNLRYACGTTATTTTGMLLEPGRDSGFIPSKGTVTVICATAATNQAAGIQWVLSS